MAPKWSSSPRIPALRLAAAATCGWPPSHAARASAAAAVPGHHGRTIRAQSLREGGGPDGDSREPLLQEQFHGGVHRLVPAPGQAGIGGGYVGLQREQPGIQHRAERARREGGRAKGLADPPVDGLQLVQRGLGLGDLHLRGGESSAQGPFGQVTGEEGLAGAVLATDGLERGAAPGHGVQVCVQGRSEALQPDGQQVQAVRRDSASAAGRR